MVERSIARDIDRNVLMSLGKKKRKESFSLHKSSYLPTGRVGSFKLWNFFVSTIAIWHP